VPRPWDPPESEFPAVVPIDTLPFAQSEQAAIAITGIRAYTEGFEILISRCIRPDVPGLDEDPTPEMLRRHGADPLAAPFSLLLSDATRVVSGRATGESEPPGPILRLRGGGGTTHSQFFRWWAWPLPPAGRLEFVCQWPMYGIAETRVGIDAQLILDAAQRSVRLWLRGEDAELVALGVGEDVPLDVLVAGADQRRAQAEQFRLVAGDVQVHPVLRRLRLGHRVDPDQRPLARRIHDRDRPVGRTRLLALAPHVADRRAPPVGQGLMIAGVEAEILEACWHAPRVTLASELAKVSWRPGEPRRLIGGYSIDPIDRDQVIVMV
jgi:hypothetical protein